MCLGPPSDSPIFLSEQAKQAVLCVTLSLNNHIVGVQTSTFASRVLHTFFWVGNQEIQTAFANVHGWQRRCLVVTWGSPGTQARKQADRSEPLALHAELAEKPLHSRNIIQEGLNRHQATTSVSTFPMSAATTAL